MPADHSDSSQIEKRLKTAAQKLHLLAAEVGTAKQIIEYDSDRRKNLLARYMVPALKAGESAAAAEAHARGDKGYDNELNVMAGILEQAHQTLKAWDAEMCSWESARSLLAMQRQILGSMPE